MFAIPFVAANVMLASLGVATVPPIPSMHPNQLSMLIPGFMCRDGPDAERAAKYLIDHGENVPSEQMDAAFADRCSHDMVEVYPDDISETGFFHFNNRIVHVLKIHTNQRDFWTYWIAAPPK